MASPSASSDESAEGDLDGRLGSVEAQLREVGRQIRKLEEKRAKLEKRRAMLAERKKRMASEELHKRDWEAETFPWSSRLRELLSSPFGLSSFRPLQLSAMNGLLSGHDVFLVMPTGGGKSLCFQLPALATGGLTVVVSPLVSLMEDQVMALKARDIRAEMLNADTPKEEVTRIQNAMADKNSGLKLLYVTPEKMAKSKRFMSKLQNCFREGLLARLAIDEVHCCSQWGHDFRPDYKFLGVLKTLFPGVPVMGLTATSTAHVTEDCRKMLGLEQCLVFRAPFNRPNLYYEVRLKPESAEECVEELAGLLRDDFGGQQTGIIYTLTIKDADSLADALRQRGLSVAPYHANLESSTRSRIHRKWLSGKYQAVAATIAFGMGIDKADVRFVIHHCVSKSMENFYQESGRAGRDDRPARCIAYFRLADIFRISTMVFTERTGMDKLYGMLAYCTDFNRCRRSIIAEHFGEVWDSSAATPPCCDVCARSTAGHCLPGAGAVARAALKAVAHASHAMDAKLTALKLANAVLCKGEAKFRIPNWAKDPALSRLDVEFTLVHLLLEGYLKEDFQFTPYQTISYLVAGPRELAGDSVGPVTVPSVVSSPKGRTNKRKKRSEGEEDREKKAIKGGVRGGIFEVICLGDSPEVGQAE